MWSDFLKHAVAFLLTEGRDQDDVVAAAVGLIVYGVTTEKELQGVADNKEEFKRQLTADKDGVPAAICDMLFAQYVAPAKALHTGARKRSLEEAAMKWLTAHSELLYVRGTTRLRTGMPASLANPSVDSAMHPSFNF